MKTLLFWVCLLLSTCGGFNSNLNYSQKLSSTVATGTGFAVSDHMVVTAGHLCSSGAIYGMVIIKTNEHADLCLLYTLKEQTSILKISKKDAKFGDKVFIVGFPSGIHIITEGFVGDDYSPIEKVISAPAFFGSSGSPVLNEEGRVVGILVSGSPGYHHISVMVNASIMRSFLSGVW